MPQSYTVCLSGPESTRAAAEVGLEDARVPILPSEHHNAHWGARVPLDAGHAVLVVDHPDVDHVARAVESAGWVLRTHHHSHDAPPANPVQTAFAEYERRLIVLERQLPLPPIRGGAVESPPFANQASSYSAEQTRRAVFAAYARTGANSPGIISGGLLSSADLQSAAPGSGMSTNVSTGECVIGGTEGGAQGGYYARASSTTNLTISAASPSNPRIDLVVATVSDSGYTEPTGGSGDQWALQVITGTPTGGATLTNLLGVGSVPQSSLLLAYVLVPTSATNIITADIENVAAVALLNSAIVGLPGPWLPLGFGTNVDAASIGYTPSVRLEGPDVIKFKGILQCTGGVTAGVTMATIPSSAMYPTATVRKDVNVGIDASTATVIEVTSTGLLSCAITLASTDLVELDGFSYTLS